MKKENKFKRLGRENALFLRFFICSAVNEPKRIGYIRKFLRELAEYSFRPHKVDEEKHEGCYSWLEDLCLSDRDYRNLRNLALLIKATMDGFYEKEHARGYYAGILDAFAGV